MATLTLGKSVTTDAVRSKKGDAVFVERRRRVVAPNSKELRDEPSTPPAPRNATDEKLRAVLAAAKAREEERKKREAEEAAARAARDAEIERENREYEQVREQLAARENTAEKVADDTVVEQKTKTQTQQRKVFTKIVQTGSQMQKKTLRNPARFICVILLWEMMMTMMKSGFVAQIAAVQKRH